MINWNEQVNGHLKRVTDLRNENRNHETLSGLIGEFNARNEERLHYVEKINRYGHSPDLIVEMRHVMTKLRWSVECLAAYMQAGEE